MPGANFWAVLLFFTLVVLGFSSAFVMLDVVATLLVDSGLKYSRPTIVTGLTLLSFLMCIPYCTEFGYYLLDGIDRWVNNIALIFVVWTEVVGPTTCYRKQDVIDQLGAASWYLYQFGYFGGQLIGVSIAQGVNAGGGAGAGLGLWLVCTIGAIVIAKAPTVPAPPIEFKIPLLGRLSFVPVIRAPAALRGTVFFSKFWWLAFYSVSSLSRISRSKCGELIPYARATNFAAI
jgi:solute carrier family 6 GABA transporter-like protein 1